MRGAKLLKLFRIPASMIRRAEPMKANAR
jgi:hypothetical protein